MINEIQVRLKFVAQNVTGLLKSVSLEWLGTAIKYNTKQGNIHTFRASLSIWFDLCRQF